MSNAQDQPVRDPRAGATATSGAATGGAATGGTPPQADAPRQYVPRPAPGYDDVGPPVATGTAVGLTLMAAVLMMLSGIWGFLEGLAAIMTGSFFIVLPNYAYSVSATGWGWLHLILGVLVFAAGVALVTDALWARITGVILASFSAIANFLFIPYSPVWSIVVIAIDLLVIWALLTPRREWT